MGYYNPNKPIYDHVHKKFKQVPLFSLFGQKALEIYRALMKAKSVATGIEEDVLITTERARLGSAYKYEIFVGHDWETYDQIPNLPARHEKYMSLVDNINSAQSWKETSMELMKLYTQMIDEVWPVKERYLELKSTKTIPYADGTFLQLKNIYITTDVKACIDFLEFTRTNRGITMCLALTNKYIKFWNQTMRLCNDGTLYKHLGAAAKIIHYKFNVYSNQIKIIYFQMANKKNKRSKGSNQKQKQKPNIPRGKARPTSKTLKRPSGRSSNANHNDMASGSDFLTRVTLVPGPELRSGIALLASIDIRPASFANTRLFQLSQLYERVKFITFSIGFKTTLPNSVNCLCVGYFDTDPDTHDSPSSSDSVLRIAQSHLKAVTFKANTSVTMPMPIITKDRPLYTGTSTDRKLTVHSRFRIYQVGAPTNFAGEQVTNQIIAGVLNINWKVAFSLPQLSISDTISDNVSLKSVLRRRYLREKTHNLAVTTTASNALLLKPYRATKQQLDSSLFNQAGWYLLNGGSSTSPSEADETMIFNAYNAYSNVSREVDHLATHNNFSGSQAAKVSTFLAKIFGKPLEDVREGTDIMKTIVQGGSQIIKSLCPVFYDGVLVPSLDFVTKYATDTLAGASRSDTHNFNFSSHYLGGDKSALTNDIPLIL
jgi:peptidoglycan hydrolase-like protein with peptidoglycan-binding domain